MVPDAWPPGEVPAWLEEASRANRYYEFVGERAVHADPTRRWPPEIKWAYWSDVVAKEAQKLDVLPEDHPWYDPPSYRLFGLGADLYAVADLAGHRTTEETQPYLPHHGGQNNTLLSLHGETSFHKW